MKLCTQAVGLVCVVLMAIGCHDAPIGDDFAKHKRIDWRIRRIHDLVVGFQPGGTGEVQSHLDGMTGWQFALPRGCPGSPELAVRVKKQ